MPTAKSLRDVGPLRNQARALMRDGRFEEAIESWNGVIEFRTDDTEAHMALARIHVHAQRYLEALQCLAVVLRSNATHAEAIRLRDRAATKVLEHVEADLFIEDIGRSAELMSQLKDLIGDHPLFRAIAEYVAYFSERKSRDFADFANLSLSQMVMLADELTRNQEWERYFALVEQLLATPWSSELNHILAAQIPTLSALSPSRAAAIPLLRFIETRVPLQKQARIDPSSSSLGEELEELLAALRSTPSALTGNEWSELERSALGLVRADASLAGELSQFYLSMDLRRKALQVYLELARDALDFDSWLSVLALATDPGVADDALEIAKRALGASRSSSAPTKIASVLVKSGLSNQAIEFWRSLGDYRLNLKARRGVLRIFYAEGRDVELLEEGRAALADVPFGTLSKSDSSLMFEIVRMIVRSGIRSRADDAVASIEAVLRGHERSAGTSWALGMLATTRPDPIPILQHFSDGLAISSTAPAPINFDAEIAMVHARHYEFGLAAKTFASLERTDNLTRDQRAQKDLVERVGELCGVRCGLRYPECVIDVILEELTEAPLGYVPREKTLLTVVSSLDQGGSERQTVTVLGKMANDARLAQVSLAVRSTDTDEKSFFLPDVQKMPVGLFLYGSDWQTRSSARQMLPELAGRERLLDAIDLLPRNLQEDLVRLWRLILNERPQAVHIRQDLYGAALACAAAGVPKTVLHRGSLSPDLWGHDKLDTDRHLRPMRYIYRRLLEGNDFVIVNNSAVGSRTDKEWTQWSRPDCFGVVHNAYEFDTLGAALGKNLELRAQLGIAPDAFVIGTAFRFVAVKRPMLWIEAARRIVELLPQAHFLIMGDGPMMEDVRQYAASHGFGHRLHLPGRVSDVGVWYRAMDLNLLTSEREGLPNVLIEGQHFSVPVVAADVGGASETFDVGVTGFLVSPHSHPEVFASIVGKALGDNAWLENARKKAPEFVHTTFSAERTVDQLLQYLGFLS